ncbi:hypothetical protein QFZ55_005511 [Streptomyces luteogriseus]|nr:hypothetical protein [Streptomyces luteogriseus]
MPHLTRSRRRTSDTELRPGVGVPGYAHPLLAPTEWGELTRPGTPLHWVVLNVADGPGTRPDPHCLEAAGRLRNAGIRVLGHLDTRYGTRNFGELISDAHRFVDWYQVDGFLLERCPADHAGLPEVRRTVATLRVIRDAAHIVLGHGIHPHPGYVELADQLVTFSGPLDRLPLVPGGRVDRRPCARAFLPLRPRRAPPPPGRGAAHRPLAGRGDGLDHRPHGSRRKHRPLGGHARLLGRIRLAYRNRCLGMKKGMALLRGEQP